MGNLHDIHRAPLLPGHRVDSAVHCDEAVQVEGAIDLAMKKGGWIQDGAPQL